MKNLLKKFNLKDMMKAASDYGYNFSEKELIAYIFVVLGIAIGVGYISKLQIVYLILLLVFTVLSFPLLLRAWLQQKNNTKKFDMIVDYLSNILPVFMQKAKIRYALGELTSLTNGKMQELIYKAIDYIDNNTKDVYVNETALGFIEEEFPNTRIMMAHRLMLTVEKVNSNQFMDACRDAYNDIEAWIKRVMSYQQDIKDRRNKAIILCLMVLGMNCIFVYLYTTNEFFFGFTDAAAYQIVTTIFIASIIIVVIATISKLHGAWLIYDSEIDPSSDYLRKEYELVKAGERKPKAFSMAVGGIFIGLGIISFSILGQLALGLLFFACGGYVIYSEVSKVSNARKKVKKHLMVEFPSWLREVSLSMRSHTVINSIESIKDQTSYPLRMEIENFLENVKRNPATLDPYVNFLKDFEMVDATSAMKVLFSIQNIGTAKDTGQMANLTYRNQEMLDKAEQIRNKDSLATVELIGYAPTLLFTAQTIVTMLLLLSHVMDTINGMMAEVGF